MRTLYLHEELRAEFKIPSTNNRIEGGVNACLRDMLHNHRGLSVERRIKAVFGWCYMHSPKLLSAYEILKTMPTNKSIADIYKKMTAKGKLENTIPMWVMQLSGVSYIILVGIQFTGISHQHFLSYDPIFLKNQ